MTYGTSNLDTTKGLVLFSCAFNVFMSYLIFSDPAYTVASESGGGWWDFLQEAGDDDPRRFIYPRIWAYRLILELLVRVNWVFEVENSPALYRCVLMTYVLPMVQMTLECFYYQTLPPFNPGEMVLFNLPWFRLILGYTKYTKNTAITPPATTTTTTAKKKD